HVECSAIAHHTLPIPFTVQGGGYDLRFPHHEFSAAHATSVTGQPMAEHYVHSGMVGLDGVKMSKSLGNLKLVWNLIASGESPMTNICVLCDHHNRLDWPYTHEAVATACKLPETLNTAIALELLSDAETLTTTIFAALPEAHDAPVALQAIVAGVEKAIQQ